MSRVLPILFNTDMVRATLDRRKTVIRSAVKDDIDAILHSPYHKEHPEVSDKVLIEKLCNPPCRTGDILYVRETWAVNPNPNMYGNYYYKANRRAVAPSGTKWKPSVNMPKEAARIWLKVTNVRVERLQDITEEQAAAEGIDEFNIGMGERGFALCYDSKAFYDIAISAFMDLWYSTIKKSDLYRYCWDANPWVWVIEFEGCEKPEPCILAGGN